VQRELALQELTQWELAEQELAQRASQFAPWEAALPEAAAQVAPLPTAAVQEFPVQAQPALLQAFLRAVQGPVLPRLFPAHYRQASGNLHPESQKEREYLRPPLHRRL